MVKMKKVCWAALLIIVVSGGWVAAEGSEPIPGMISYWNLDEGEGDIAYDFVGNNDGILNDPCWATGQIGGALNFDGLDDYVDLGTDSSIKPDFPITFSAWIKRYSTGNSHGIVLLGRGAFSWYKGSWFNITYYDKLNVAYGDGEGSKPEDRRNKTGTTTILAGAWYHVAGIIRGPLDMDLYVNGNNDGGTYSGSGGNVRYAGVHGSSFIGGTVIGIAPFDGLIDDVAVFNRALTPEEIQKIYQDGLAGLGLIDYRQIAIGKIEKAIDAKTEAIELVNLAIEKERAAFRTLNALRDSGDLGELSLVDVFRAKLDILWAMARQIRAKFNLHRSINKLEKALDKLTPEPEAIHKTPTHPEESTRPSLLRLR